MSCRVTYGFLHSVRLLNSSTISSNLWSRRSWSADARPYLGPYLGPRKYLRFASVILAISRRNSLIRSVISCDIAKKSRGRQAERRAVPYYRMNCVNLGRMHGTLVSGNHPRSRIWIL